jgi:hypothetical protein
LLISAAARFSRKVFSVGCDVDAAASRSSDATRASSPWYSVL